jgi:histidinol-phosphate aminotransferase
VTLSRRAFAQILGAGAAAAALPFPTLAASKQATATGAAAGAVRLSSNENPYGPSPQAVDAMREAFSLVWRYPDESQDALTHDLATLLGVPDDQVLLGDGSSEILRIAASAFMGPDRKLVLAAPTFEAIALAAPSTGAEVVNIPLTPSHAHDLQAMGAVKGAGLVYICNPNNPTATITPRAALASFIDSVPPTTIVLVDEAYHHYADSDDYASVIPLVKTHPNLVVARTFSKIFGMAGLRLGYAVAQKPLLDRMNAHQQFDSVNVMAIAAGRASVGDAEHVRVGKERNMATRKMVTDELAKSGFKTLPSQANFIMIDIGREVKPVIAAFREHNVHVGRVFPAMPKHLRVTIGRPEQMTAFLDAFKVVVT